MRPLQPHLSVMIFLLLILGCEGPFSPKGTYRERMVVYAILTTQSDAQFVKVFATYNPPGFDPLENTTQNVVRDAVVTVSDGDSNLVYRDTIVTRIDKSRYQDDLAVYVAQPFRVLPKKSYTLTVVSQTYGRVTASLTVPDRGRVQVVNPYVLRGGGEEDESLVILAWIRYAARGFMVRFYLEYETLESGAWVTKRMEIPSRAVVVGDAKIFSYPKLERRTTSQDPALREKEEMERVYFSRLAYATKTSELRGQYSSDRLRITGAWFVLTQVESNLYAYYSIANAFQDPHSIRTDLPDWTNIEGGYGVFGAMVEDSAYVSLR